MNIKDYIIRNLELIKEIQSLYSIIKNKDKKVYDLEKEIYELNAENDRLKRKNSDLSRLIIIKDDELNSVKVEEVKSFKKEVKCENIYLNEFNFYLRA